MNSIIVKHKEYEIEEIISNNIFKCSFKNKTYIIYKLNVEMDNYKNYLFLLSKLFHSGVKVPKLKVIDKKNGYVVKEFLEGTTIFDYIVENDFNEDIYKSIFFNSYCAKMAGLNLSFDLKNWTIVGKDLVYNDIYVEKYDPKKDFTKTKIREWFMGNELFEYYKNNGILLENSRKKSEFEVNKEMVLMTCKYYL